MAIASATVKKLVNFQGDVNAMAAHHDRFKRGAHIGHQHDQSDTEMDAAEAFSNSCWNPGELRQAPGEHTDRDQPDER